MVSWARVRLTRGRPSQSTVSNNKGETNEGETTKYETEKKRGLRTPELKWAWTKENWGWKVWFGYMVPGQYWSGQIRLLLLYVTLLSLFLYLSNICHDKVRIRELSLSACVCQSQEPRPWELKFWDGRGRIQNIKITTLACSVKFELVSDKYYDCSVKFEVVSDCIFSLQCNIWPERSLAGHLRPRVKPSNFTSGQLTKGFDISRPHKRVWRTLSWSFTHPANLQLLWSEGLRKPR